MKRYIGILDPVGGYGRAFDALNLDVIPMREYNGTKTGKLAVVVFTGGTDVDPALYGEKPHPFTNNPDKERDALEKIIFEVCSKEGIPMVGICRGAQFLCVMNGDSLYQHVSFHGQDHTLRTKSDLNGFTVSSTHHQLMRPSYHKAQLLAWASQGALSEPEPEVVWYPKTKCLCVQYHPEYLSLNEPGRVYFRELLKEYVL